MNLLRSFLVWAPLGLLLTSCVVDQKISPQDREALALREKMRVYDAPPVHQQVFAFDQKTLDGFAQRASKELPRFSRKRDFSKAVIYGIDLAKSPLLLVEIPTSSDIGREPSFVRVVFAPTAPLRKSESYDKHYSLAAHSMDSTWEIQSAHPSPTLFRTTAEQALRYNNFQLQREASSRDSAMPTATPSLKSLPPKKQ